jgi:sucrose-phosphate synthase
VRRARARMEHEIGRFLNQPDKPIVLAISRPDRRKNIEGLVTAYGEDKELQRIANLAIFAGVRRDIRDMQDNEREVLTELLLLMDRYDLYGRMALPKRHEPDVDIPVLYRLAAASGGVFINPALVENFGITVIEAASSGLPVVSTDHGGPKDIIGATDAGLLIDARDTAAMQQALRRLLTDREAWAKHARAGAEGVRRHFSWAAHADRYLELVGR